MATFRETRNALLVAHDQNIINEEQFCLLYDLNSSKNYDYQYWSYPSFELDTLSDDECLGNFRFLKSDVYRVPVEGSRHDSGMLAQSNLLNILQQHSRRPNGGALCIYGDPAYPLRIHLQCIFAGNLTNMQQQFNSSMSKMRISVEWLFKEISTYFAFMDFN